MSSDPPHSASRRSTAWYGLGSPPPGSEVFLWRRRRQPKEFVLIAILLCCAACRMLPMTEAPPTKLTHTDHITPHSDCCYTWTDLDNLMSGLMETHVCWANVGYNNNRFLQGIGLGVPFWRRVGITFLKRLSFYGTNTNHNLIQHTLRRVNRSELKMWQHHVSWLKPTKHHGKLLEQIHSIMLLPAVICDILDAQNMSLVSW